MSMKGYLSFVIVFLFALISISLIYILYTSQSYHVDESRMLISETVYAHLLDFRHSAVSITRTTTKAVIAEYLVEVVAKSAASGGVDTVAELIDPDILKERIKTAVSTGLMIIPTNVDGLKMSCDTLGTPYTPKTCGDDIHVMLNIMPENMSADVSFNRLGFRYCYKDVCDTGYLPKTMKIHTDVSYH